MQHHNGIFDCVYVCVFVCVLVCLCLYLCFPLQVQKTLKHLNKVYMPHLLWLLSLSLFLYVCLRSCHTLFATQFATMLWHVDDAATCSRHMIELPQSPYTHIQTYIRIIYISVYFRHEVAGEKFSH